MIVKIFIHLAWHVNSAHFFLNLFLVTIISQISMRLKFLYDEKVGFKSVNVSRPFTVLSAMIGAARWLGGRVDRNRLVWEWLNDAKYAYWCETQNNGSAPLSKI